MARVKKPAPRVETPLAQARQPAPRVELPLAHVRERAPRVRQPAPHVREPAPRVEVLLAHVREHAPIVRQPAPCVREPAPCVGLPTGARPRTSPDHGTAGHAGPGTRDARETAAGAPRRTSPARPTASHARPTASRARAGQRHAPTWIRPVEPGARHSHRQWQCACPRSRPVHRCASDQRPSVWCAPRGTTTRGSPQPSRPLTTGKERPLSCPSIQPPRRPYPTGRLVASLEADTSKFVK